MATSVRTSKDKSGHVERSWRRDLWVGSGNKSTVGTCSVPGASFLLSIGGEFLDMKLGMVLSLNYQGASFFFLFNVFFFQLLLGLSDLWIVNLTNGNHQVTVSLVMINVWKEETADALGRVHQMGMNHFSLLLFISYMICFYCYI